MNKNVTIRRAEIKDIFEITKILSQIAELHHQGRPDIFKSGTQKYNKEEFENILNDPNRPVFVAVDENDTVLGYCFCMVVQYAKHAVFNDYSSLYIDDFCVYESYRGQGIGKKIFMEVKEYAKQIGVYNIDLNVWEFNESARKFYENCGFVTQRRRMEMIL
ncbi:MAG: GNAT family N-acetyltransferase [Oscillospiraceae bacterium]|nr:GNAT family N-acetyltransferase [Oscillospiraceae bacterium]